MELIVSEIKELEPIKFNYEQLKEELTQKVKEYKNIVYTEDNIKEAKTDRANLNKLAKAINDEKIRVKNEVLEPYKLFEKQCNELVELVKEASEHADIQIKSYEQQQKDEKLKKINEFFEQNVEELIDLLNFDKIYNEKWLNVTYKMSDIEAEIKHIITKSRQDLIVIKNLNTEFENQLIDYYFRTLNLSETMGEKTRLEEQKKKIEELQQRTKNTQNVTKNTGNITKSSQNITSNQQMQQIDFRVWVTQEQKLLLREFLIKNNIKYGKVI